MGSRSTPKTYATGDSRPSLLSLGSSIGGAACQGRQSGHTGDSHHFTPGDEWIRPHRAIFSHLKAPCVAVWQSLKALIPPPPFRTYLIRRYEEVALVSTVTWRAVGR